MNVAFLGLGFEKNLHFTVWPQRDYWLSAYLKARVLILVLGLIYAMYLLFESGWFRQNRFSKDQTV